MFVCSFSSVSFYLFVSSSSLVSVGFLGCVVLVVGLYCDSFLSQVFFIIGTKFCVLRQRGTYQHWELTEWSRGNYQRVQDSVYSIIQVLFM